MITLGVQDVEASAEFYEKGLGFPRIESEPTVAFFDLHGSWLGLYGRDALAEDANVRADGSGFDGFALAHNVHSEAEVNEVFNTAIQAGAKSVKKPEKVFWGGYSGYFSDPDGYHWEIAWGPMFEFTEQGDLKFKPTV